MKMNDIFELPPNPLTHFFGNNNQLNHEREVLTFNEYHTDLSFEEIVNIRVKKILEEANGKELILLFSGGLDSTMIYYALVNNNVKFKIFMTDMSQVENYNLFNNIINSNIPHEIYDSHIFLDVLKNHNDDNSVFITGDLGDQVFLSNLTYNHFYDNRHMPYRMIIPIEVIKYTENKVNKILQNNITATMANWCWAVDFIYRWDFIKDLFKDEIEKNVITFFEDIEFEKYSVTNQIKNSRYNKFNNKQDIRDYILKYGKDLEYVTYKTKIGSQRMFFRPEIFKQDYYKNS